MSDNPADITPGNNDTPKAAPVPTQPVIIMDDWPAELSMLVASKTGEGIAVALALFSQNNRIPSKPSKSCEDTLGDALLRVTSEFAAGNQSYPFGEDSLEDRLCEVVQEYCAAIEFMWKNSDRKDLSKFLVVISCGQTLEFFEKHKKEVEELFAEVRKGK